MQLITRVLAICVQSQNNAIIYHSHRKEGEGERERSECYICNNHLSNDRYCQKHKLKMCMNQYIICWRMAYVLDTVIHVI